MQIDGQVRASCLRICNIILLLLSRHVRRDVGAN